MKQKREEYLIAYSSITIVMQIKKAMSLRGETVYIIPTPKSIPVNDCSYSVRVKDYQLKSALEISKEYKFKMKGVYKKINEQEYEKVVT